MKGLVCKLCNIVAATETYLGFTKFWKSPKYLLDIIPKIGRTYSTSNANSIIYFEVKHYSKIFFLSITKSLNKVDPKI